MQPPGKHILYGLKEYQKHIPKSKISILTTLLLYYCYVTPGNSHFMWTEGISKNILQSKI